jgi:anti-sigma factor RsiW
MTNLHLTESQLYSLLDAPGTLSMGASQHLRACPRCGAEFKTLRDSLDNFRLAATSLSLLHTPSRAGLAAVTRRHFFTFARTAWATGLAAAMALGTASLSLLHKPVAVTPVPTVASSSQQKPPAESDDALLQSVDQDLSTSVPPSLQPLDVTPAGESTTSNQN